MCGVSTVLRFWPQRLGTCGSYLIHIERAPAMGARFERGDQRRIVHDGFHARR